MIRRTAWKFVQHSIYVAWKRTRKLNDQYFMCIFRQQSHSTCALIYIRMRKLQMNITTERNWLGSEYSEYLVFYYYTRT